MATPPNPDNLFTVQQPEETFGEPDVSNPPHNVSSTEPDLSNYTMPPPDEPDLEEKSSPSWQTTWAIIREVGETIILTLIIFLVIQLFIRNFRVVGTSMVNNLHDGQYLIIDKISYSPFLRDDIGIGGPTRGDVIVFKPPRNPEDDYVKRIIGLPGEKIQVIKGQIFVNDQLLEELFEPVAGTYSMPAPVIVPEGQVFVLGDNRNNSNDSHNWGPLPMENIVGRAWLSYWPPDQWGAIPRDAPAEEATLKYYVGQFIPTANAQNE
jgi:signal peptidase I